MNEKINKITRWTRFKENRTQVIDEYIKAKKKVYMIKQLRILVALSQILKAYKTKFIHQ